MSQYNLISKTPEQVLLAILDHTNDYDDLGQVKSGRKYWADGTPVAGQQFGYAFDDIGNRTSTVAGGDENGGNLRAASYSPNTLNQYTSRTVPGYVDIMGVSFATNTVTVNGQTAYRKGEYFRKELPINNTSALSTNITVAATGQSSVTGSMLVAKASESFWHDLDGNLLSDSLWTNKWNAENRLVQVESTTAIAANKRMREVWTHLPDGRWIERIVSTNNGSAYYPAFTNRFIWDGQVLMAILDHTNGLVMSFVRGLDLSGSIQGAGGVGGVLAIIFKTNGVHFVSYDGNGNVVALTDASTGTASGQLEYGPFSEPIRVTGTAAQQMPLRFSTMYEDSVTGDRKYLFRDLSPSMGRWKSRDPIDEKSLSNKGMMFGRNDGLNYFDLWGLYLAAVDGTSSSKWVVRDPETWRWNSHTRNFFDDSMDAAGYWHGPGWTGKGVMAIVLSVYTQVCARLQENPDEKIDMIGHSRGGLIVILAASMLKEKPCVCGVTNRIRFMGLYDAVDMYNGASGRVISDNVDYVAHARRDPAVMSRANWGNTGTSGGKVYVQQFFRVTHSGAGGDPWGGDHPTDYFGRPLITEEEDKAGSRLVDEWIRSHACGNGLPGIYGVPAR